MRNATLTGTTAVTFADHYLVGYTEHPRLTRDTIAFDAEVHHQDTALGVLSNNGDGGPDRFLPHTDAAAQAVAEATAAFGGIPSADQSFAYDLLDALAVAAATAKTLLGSRYLSMVPDMSPEEIVVSEDELRAFRAPRSAGHPYDLALGLLEQHPEMSSVLYPARERRGVWLYRVVR